MPVIEGRKISGKNVTLDCDVLVVGSGAGGASCATRLAKNSIDVILLEEGPHIDPGIKQKYSVSEAMAKIYRNHGLTASVGFKSPAISLPMGRGTGGSSQLTGGVCFRTPDHIMHNWENNLGLKSLSGKNLEKYFQAVEEDCSIKETEESLVPLSHKRFRESAQNLGYKVNYMKRNMVGCKGCARCNFICPEGAKKSVDISYIPSFLEAGGRLYSDFQALNLTYKFDELNTISGIIKDKTGKKKGEFKIRAKFFILALGAVHTPDFLKKNKITGNNQNIGKNLTIHPGARVIGIFDQVMNPHLGAHQSIFIDRIKEDGILLNAIFLPKALIAGTLPGFGEELFHNLKRENNTVHFGVMSHKEKPGRVISTFFRDPVIFYEFSEEAKNQLVNGCIKCAEIYFEGGAKEVLLPVHGFRKITSREDLKKINTSEIKIKDLELGAFHPLGTCAIGKNDISGVVDEKHRFFPLKNLYISDGSVVPTSLGVNSQETIMAFGLRCADMVLDRILR